MKTARRALLWSFASQYLNTIIQLATTVTLARLLAPAEIGIYSMAATFVLLGQMLRDFGSGQYIIQEKELTDDRIRAAFTVTLCTGWLVALAVFVFAPYAAEFFREPGVERVMHLLAVNFALIPFGSITMAYLQRQMRFRKTLLVRVTSGAIGSAVSVAGAFAGMSYLALAWGAVSTSVAAIILANIVRPRELPRLPGFREIPRVLSFASRMSGSTVVMQLGPVAGDMIIGRVLGAAALGLLSRSQGVIMLFESLVMRGLHPVLTPLFAHKHRAGDELATSYLFAMTCVTGLAWPFFGGLAVVAPDFIAVLLGDKWLETVPLVQILCIAMFINTTVNMASHVFIATGQVGLMLKRQLISMPVNVALTLLLAQISLQAVALGSIPGALFWMLLILGPVLRLTGIRPDRFARALLASLVPAVATTLAAWATVATLDWYGITHSLLRLFASGLVGGLVYLIVLKLGDHPLSGELTRVLNKVRSRPATGSA